jgi:hypothetical protein
MQTVTLPDAQTLLPKLAQKVLEGEWIVIPFAGKNMVLHLAEDGFPPPVREPGYFADCLEEDEFRDLEIAAAAHCPTTMVP